MENVIAKIVSKAKVYTENIFKSTSVIWLGRVVKPIQENPKLFGCACLIAVFASAIFIMKKRMQKAEDLSEEKIENLNKELENLTKKVEKQQKREDSRLKLEKFQKAENLRKEIRASENHLLDPSLFKHLDPEFLKEIEGRCDQDIGGAEEVVNAFKQMERNWGLNFFEGASLSFSYCRKKNIDGSFTTEFKFVSADEIALYYPFLKEKTVLPLPKEEVIKIEVAEKPVQITTYLKICTIWNNFSFYEPSMPENLSNLFTTSKVQATGNLSEILKVLDAGAIISLIDGEYKGERIKFLNTLLKIDACMKKQNRLQMVYNSAESDSFAFALHQKTIIVVGAELDNGSFKKVSSAVLLNTSKKIVEIRVKSNPKWSLPEKKMIEKELKEEEEILKKLSKNNPDLIPPYEYVIKENSDGLVMFQSLFDGNGKSLFGASLWQKFNVFQDVARGLSKMHEDGYVHSDVKPANILIQGDVAAGGLIKAKIADLGGAEKIGLAIKAANLFCMAPEGLTIISGDKVGLKKIKLSPELDSFALGVTMLQLLTSEEYIDIYLGSSSDDRIKDIIDDVKMQAEKSAMNPFYKKLVFKMLELIQGLLIFDPKKRYSCAYVRDVLSLPV